MAGATFESRRTTCAAHPTGHTAHAPDGIVDSPCVPHASQEQQSTLKSRAMATDGAPPSAHCPRTSHSPGAMVARMPSARTLTFTACSGQLRAVVRASQTDLACARARPPQASLELYAPLAPDPTRMQGPASIRQARARRWRARDPARVCGVPSERLREGTACALTSQVRAATLMTWRSGRLRATSACLRASLVAMVRPRPCRYCVVRCPGWCMRSVCGRGAGRLRSSGSPRPQYALSA